MSITNVSIQFVKTVYKPLLIYVICMMLHNLASNLYSDICAPKGFKGIFMSIFTINTPHCESLRWVIVNTSWELHNMWIILGSYISCVFIKNISQK
jgi:hypothetical protein